MVNVPIDSPIVTWFKAQPKPIIFEGIRNKRQVYANDQNQPLEEIMRSLSASVIIPSFSENKLMGFLVLGAKLSGEIFTIDDLNVFQTLASQAALAVENVQFYEEAKEMQAQIVQTEKMASIGTMADGLSHQINNRFHAVSFITGDTIDTLKLTDISGCSPRIQEVFKEVNAALARIQDNVIKGGEVVSSVMKYTRQGQEGFEALSLDRIITETLDMLQYKIKLTEIKIVKEYLQTPLKIKGNSVQLVEAFFNIIDNAYDSIVERKLTLKEPGYLGKIVISAQGKRENLEITLQDNGMGIRKEDMKKIFTPFFTTKASSKKGTGLGLYVIRHIINDLHKGSISFESEYKAGTKFIIELPIAE
jgi:two-component system NtrC family sensor kinase